MKLFLRRTHATLALASLILSLIHSSFASSFVQERHSLTPLQLEIQKQVSRLGSADVEDRRDALIRLRSLQHPEASRAALAALNDGAPIVRATAAAATLYLPATEAAPTLIPLLSDKDEFVRQHAAYALGRKGNTTAVIPLIERLADKKDSVRGAAAVALGEIADAQALPSLVAVLSPPITGPKKSKNKLEKNVLVLRAATHSLGQIGRREAAPVLIGLLQDEKAEPDLRREAAIALGKIRDDSALPALRAVLTASDPYLSQSAFDAIKQISMAR